MQERHDLPTAANIIRGEGGPGSGSGGDLLLYGPCYGGGVGCIGGYIGKAGSGSGGTSCCLPQVRHSHSAGTGLVCVKGSAGYHALLVCPNSRLFVAVRNRIGEGIVNRRLRLAVGPRSEERRVGKECRL